MDKLPMIVRAVAFLLCLVTVIAATFLRIEVSPELLAIASIMVGWYFGKDRD